MGVQPARPGAPSTGSADCNLPSQQSQLLDDALAAKNGPDKATITLLDGAGHGGAQFETAENVKIVVDFLNQALAK